MIQTFGQKFRMFFGREKAEKSREGEGCKVRVKCCFCEVGSRERGFMDKKEN